MYIYSVLKIIHQDFQKAYYVIFQPTFVLKKICHVINQILLESNFNSSLTYFFLSIL